MAWLKYVRYSQFFKIYFGIEVTWLGGVEKFVLVLPVLHLAASGTLEPISVPMESLSIGFSGFGSGLKSLTFMSNKRAHKNVEKRHQRVEVAFA